MNSKMWYSVTVLIVSALWLIHVNVDGERIDQWMDGIVWTLLWFYFALELTKRWTAVKEKVSTEVDSACLLVWVVFWVIPGRVLPRLVVLLTFAVKLCLGYCTYVVVSVAYGKLTSKKFYEDAFNCIVWVASSDDVRKKFCECWRKVRQLVDFGGLLRSAKLCTTFLLQCLFAEDGPEEGAEKSEAESENEELNASESVVESSEEATSDASERGIEIVQLNGSMDKSEEDIVPLSPSENACDAKDAEAVAVEIMDTN